MLNGKIDLRSDTITQPTGAMREAMMAAPLGDDVFGDDPTVTALERKVAAMLTMEAALFVPSGTMANLLAIMTQTRPGDSVILSDLAHPIHYEAANAAQIAGVMFRPVQADRGILSADDVQAHAVLMDDPHLSHTKLVMVENTMNLGGGAVYTPAQVEAVATAAHELGMKVHCDGARIFNACVEAKAEVSAYARHVDSMSLCLSKGLGCPAGSLIAGSSDLVHQARRYRKALGGGMRQAGVLAAAGIYALDHHIERLAEDHENALRFREGIENLPGVEFYMPTPTNLVYFKVKDAFQTVAALAERDVLCLPESAEHVRAAFNLHVAPEDTERAIAIFHDVMSD